MQTNRPPERIGSWRDRRARSNRPMVQQSRGRSQSKAMAPDAGTLSSEDPTLATPDNAGVGHNPTSAPSPGLPVPPESEAAPDAIRPDTPQQPVEALTPETQHDGAAGEQFPRLDFADEPALTPADEAGNVPDQSTLGPWPAETSDSGDISLGYEAEFGTAVDESAIDEPAVDDRGSTSRIPEFAVPGPTTHRGKVVEGTATAPTTADRQEPVWSHGAPQTTSIEEQLDRFAWNPASRQWGNRVRRLLERWAGLERLDGPQADDVLNDLAGALRDSDQLIENVAHRPQVGPLRRIQYHLAKRLDVWSSVHRWEAAGNDRIVEPVSAARPDSARLHEVLDTLKRRLAGSPEADGWRRYLMLDALEQMADNDTPVVNEHHRQIVRKVLDRLRRAGRSQPHARFVHEPEIVRLTAELQNWAGQPLDGRTLLDNVERYEASRLPSQAEQVALAIQRLRLSDAREAVLLAEQLEQHYRNGNIRLSIHRHFLDRLLPEQRPAYENVRETILGIPIRGRSFTTVKLHFRLIPDDHHARMAIVASGATLSRTSAYNEVATIRSRSRTFFEVEKPIEFRFDGLIAQPTRATANTLARLQDVETDFDGIPIVGWLVRSEAERQFHERRSAARREAERLVAVRASQQLDEQSAEPIEVLNQRLRQRVRVPLKRLGLDRPWTDFRTTEDRLTLRARLAGDNQLGAHTPRPQAPADSLLSVQIHESAINNCLARLGLAGQTFVAPELQKKIAETLNFTPEKVSDRDDIWLSFAADDPARVRCDNGRLVVILKLDWIQKQRRRWHDVEVRVRYRPDVSLPGGQFVRDGVVQLTGQRLGARGQITLRSIFSNLFREDRTFRILPDRLTNEPWMAEMNTTQLVVEDGWIAAAVGPKAGARSRTARRP